MKTAPAEKPTEESENVPAEEPVAVSEYPTEKEALRAAMDGNFRKYCKDNGYFDSDMASKINEIFLDIIGDIVLTDENGDYELIEDYREDVLEWLN